MQEKLSAVYQMIIILKGGSEHVGQTYAPVT